MSPSLMLKRYRVWLLLFLLAAALPWLFFNWSTGRHSGFVLTMLSEIALSFNMQMGQAGLLSFGHAVLFGMGGYCTAHALNAIKAGSFWLPTELMPLVGGLGGLGFGVVFGYVATQQRATAFAMITMGIGELVAAAALMFMTFFGGEGGVTTNRMIDTSLVGASYSAPWQVYYLILVWALVCVILMRLQTQTPLGRMANATRDNFERAQFVGYDPRMVRFYQFIVSGFFAGIAGGLYAMLYEIVTFDTVSAVKSSTALLATYIGGVGVFFGPILGRDLAAERGQPAVECVDALCRRVVHRDGDVRAYGSVRHDRRARPDRPCRQAARPAGALHPGAGARRNGGAGLRVDRRTGVVHDHRRVAEQEVPGRIAADRHGQSRSLGHRRARATAGRFMATPRVKGFPEGLGFDHGRHQAPGCG